jgi:hypothetical protein
MRSNSRARTYSVLLISVIHASSSSKMCTERTVSAQMAEHFLVEVHARMQSARAGQHPIDKRTRRPAPPCLAPTMENATGVNTARGGSKGGAPAPLQLVQQWRYGEGVGEEEVEERRKMKREEEEEEISPLQPCSASATEHSVHALCSHPLSRMQVDTPRAYTLLCRRNNSTYGPNNSRHGARSTRASAAVTR